VRPHGFCGKTKVLSAENSNEVNYYRLKERVFLPKGDNTSLIYNNVYVSHRAHERVVKRKRLTARRLCLKNELIMAYVIKKLYLGWRTEKIAGSIDTDMPGKFINHEAIY